MRLESGKRYRCRSDLRRHGTTWFVRGRTYLLVSVEHSHQGEIRYVFLDEETGDRWTLEALVLDKSLGKLEEALEPCDADEAT